MSLNYPVNYDPVFCIHLYQCMGKCKTLIVAFPARVLLKAGTWLSSPPPTTAQRPEGPACHGPQPAMAQRPGGPVLIFESFLSSAKSTFIYRSASGLGVQNGGQKFMYDPMKCPEDWAFIPSTDLLSQAPISCPMHWSSISSTDLLPLALISVCPLHWSSVPSTDLLLY